MLCIRMVFHVVSYVFYFLSATIHAEVTYQFTYLTSLGRPRKRSHFGQATLFRDVSSCTISRLLLSTLGYFWFSNRERYCRRASIHFPTGLTFSRFFWSGSFAEISSDFGTPTSSTLSLEKLDPCESWVVVVGDLWARSPFCADSAENIPSVGAIGCECVGTGGPWKWS